MTYSYSSRRLPPAPYLQVTLINPYDSHKQIPCEALLDTGADFSFLPIRRLEKIDMSAAGPSEDFDSANGKFLAFPYIVQIKLDGKTYSSKKDGFYNWNEDFALIGRDLLNQIDIQFNGPDLVFRFHYPR